jgi:2-oxoglutarate ferredoxin oxidoreductase subunit alpha
MTQEINFMIGGEAGQGVQSTGLLLIKALARRGYHVFADQDYESRVRGGYNFFRVRASSRPVGAIANPVDVLIAFNKESIDLHRQEMTQGGVIIYDGEKINDVTGSNLISLPSERLAMATAGDRIMANTVALGGALGLIDYDLKLMANLLGEFFGGESGEKNIKAAEAGYQYIRENSATGFKTRLANPDGVKRMVVSGNDAMALGAIAAGCKFMAAYPMTPVTSIMEYLASKAKEFNIVVVPAEDEIAAINMVVGASYTGVRAMTATSGGGFCLMTEGLGLAGMTETPIVVIEGQRAGPAIGLPTRTEQSDLEFIIHAAHGEFPRAVLAPATIEDCFWLTIKAFNLAEKYQLPVLIITDHHLASSYGTVDRFDLSKVTIDRGLFYSAKGSEEYKRHTITETGISPRAFPGKEGTLVVTDTDEHDEAGHPVEDGVIRTRMMQKRLRKLDGLKQEINPPQYYGHEKPGTLLIGWGSTFGAIKEAVDILSKEQFNAACLHLNELFPFPTEAVSIAISEALHCYVVENNATGQLARLIRTETGLPVSSNILKYDGRPFTPTEIVQAVRKEVH